MTTHLIKKAQMPLLISKKVIILAKYLNYANTFSKKSAKILPKQRSINKYIIKLKNSMRLLYLQIYILRLIKLEKLKTYIRIEKINNIITSLKSFFNIFIRFVCKLDNSFSL